MTRINDIANHSHVSEKAIEKYLTSEVAKRGGLCLKYDNPNTVGYPDRLVILPGAPNAWVEIKSKGKKPRRIQQIRLGMLRELGQRVYVVDSREDVDKVIRSIENNEP